MVLLSDKNLLEEGKLRKLVLLFGSFLILFFIGAAFNQEVEDQDLYAEDADLGTLKIYSISPYATIRTWDGAYQNWEFSCSWFEAMVRDTHGLGAPKLSAPVYLPLGAIVKKMVVYITDNDDLATSYVDAILSWNDMKTLGYNRMASVTTNGLPSSSDRQILKDATINNAQIKNNRYCYCLEVYFGGGTGSTDLKFHGAKIIYE